MKTATVLSAGFLAVLLALPVVVGQPARTVSSPPPELPEINSKVLAFLKPVVAAEGDSELKKKLVERHNSAVRLLEERVSEYRKGARDLGFVFDAARLAAEAKLDLADDARARVAVLEQIIEIARLIETRLQDHLDKGFGSRADLERAKYTRLSAEVDLLKAKQK